MMPAIAERSPAQINTAARSTSWGRIIFPPESFWRPKRSEWKESLQFPLFYFKGLMLGPEGTKCTPKEIEYKKNQRLKRNFPEITPENFMELIGLCVLRQERTAPGLPWKESQTVFISNSPEENKRQSFILNLLDSYPNHSFISVFKLQTEFQKVSQRSLVMEIATRVEGHKVAEELFILRIVLPQGATALDVYNFFSPHNPVLSIGEQFFIGLENESWGPQYLQLKKFYEHLQKKQIGDPKQVIEGLNRINWQIETTQRTGKLICRLINGHLCALVANSQGNKEWKPILEVIDDNQTFAEILDLERRLQTTGAGQIIEYTPTGGISASTSKNSPEKKEIKNYWIKDHEGNWHNFMDENEALEFQRENYPELFNPKPNDIFPPTLIPDLRTKPRPNLIMDPFLYRRMVVGEKFNPLVTSPFAYLAQKETLSDQSERNLAPALVPLFVFPVAATTAKGAISQRIIETNNALPLRMDTAGEIAQPSLNTQDTNSRESEGNLPTPVMAPILKPDFSVVFEKSGPKKPDFHPVNTTFISYPQNPKGPGGGGEVIHVNELQIAKCELKTVSSTAQNQGQAQRIEVKSATQHADETVFNLGRPHLVKDEIIGEKEGMVGLNNTNTTQKHLTLEGTIGEKAVAQEGKKSTAPSEKRHGVSLQKTITPTQIKTNHNLPAQIGTSLPKERILTTPQVNSQKTLPSVNPAKLPIIIPPEFYQIPDPIYWQILDLQRQLLEIPQTDFFPIWQEERFEGKMKEIYHQVQQFIGDYSQIVCTIGLIFVIFLKALSGGIILV